MQIKTNKNGVKLLATVMVFAMALAGAFIISGNDSVAVVDNDDKAKIGDAGYDTFAEALSAAVDGNTIVALDNVTISNTVNINKNITIDLSTFNLTIETTGVLTIKTGKTVTITNSSSSTTNLITAKQGGQIVQEANSVLNIAHNGAGTGDVGHSSIYTPNGPVKVSMTDATLNFTTDRSVQGMYYVASGSTINATAISQGKTLVGYFDLANSTVNANNIGIVAAKLTGTSTINAVQMGVFNATPSKTINGYLGLDVGVNTGLTISTIAISENSTVTSKDIIFGLNTNGSGAGPKGITFSGDGTLFGNVELKSGITDTYAVKLIGVDYTGTISNERNGVSLAGVKADGTTGISFIKGSVCIDGKTQTPDGDGKITITGSATLKGELDAGSTIVVTEGSNVTVNGAFTNKGTIINYGTIAASSQTFTNDSDAKILNYNEFTGTAVTNNGSIGAAPGATSPTGVTTVSVTSLEDALGLNKNLDSDYTITTKAFLQDDLVINEGVTLTIGTGATLDLNGYTLTVLGTLVVKNNGTIITSAEGTIALGTTGNIDNKGIIGKTIGVKIQIAGDANNYVVINDATGIGFDKVKIVGTDSVTYYLAINGNVSKKDTGASIHVNKIIYVKDSLSIGNGVTLVIEDDAELKISKNATLDISSNGILDLTEGTTTQAAGTGTNVGKITMVPGAVITLNGQSTGVIIAESGSFETTKDYSTYSKLSTVSIEVEGLKGLSIEATSSSAYNDDVKADVTEQRILLSGEIKDADASSSTVTRLEVTKVGDAPTAAAQATTSDYYLPPSMVYAGVFVEENLFIDKSALKADTDDELTFDNAKLTVTGTVSSNLENIPDIGAVLIGAYYTVESTDAAGAKTTTHFIKSFDEAFSVIDTVKDKTINVFGPAYISDEMTLSADQKVLGAASFTIGENGKLTVENDSELSGSINVKGILFIESDASAPSETYITYDAKVKDTETGNITYYGLAAALDNAAEGSIIEVSRTASTQNLIVPAGVTVKILSTGSISVAKNLTVSGTLVNQNILTIGEKTNVEGTLDLTDGVTNTFNGQITVTGEVVMSSAYTGTYMNAFQYVNDDSEYIYTTLAKAATAVAAKDVQKTINAVGTVSESSDITLSGKTILNITGTATLGNVTLDDSKIIVTGANASMSGTIIGKSGAESSTTGAVAETVITVKDAKNITFEDVAVPNEQNVKVWSTKVTTQDASGNLAGALTIKSGVLTIANDMKIVDKNNTITVDGGLLVPAGITLTVGTDSTNSLLKVNGTADINGTLAVEGRATVSGTLNILKNKSADAATATVSGRITVTGELNIVESETLGNAGLNVSGTLFVGTKATTLGDAAAVNGPVTISGTGYILAFEGADLSAAKINNDLNGVSQAKNTQFNINGQPYMTAYAIGDVKYETVLSAASISLTGYDTTGISTISSDGKQYWFTDSDLTKNASNSAIGTNANLYYKAKALNVTFNISVGTGISMSIDGIKMTGNTYSLSVGTHSVLAVVDPGYKGTVTITFNGQTVTDGKIVVTPEMASAAYDGLKVVSATGNITIDSGDTPAPTPIQPTEKDDSLGITEYLLIVLVVLAAILVVVVAIRMMRS